MGGNVFLDLFVRSGVYHRPRPDIPVTQVISMCSARGTPNCDARILRQRRKLGEVSHRAVAGSIPIREVEIVEQIVEQNPSGTAVVTPSSR
jgi:hypothetical protein